MDIKKVIRENSWTIERVAAEMPNKNGEKGISQSALSQIINGNPTIDKLQDIANIIGVPLPVLVSDSENINASLCCPHCGQPIKLVKSE